MNKSRKLEEIVSWRLMTELWRRFPKHFDLIEAHPCSGQYDCLVLMTKGENPTFAIDVNRGGGSVHIHKNAFDLGSRMVTHSDWTGELLGKSPRRFIDSIANETGLNQPCKLPASTPATIAYRYIADFLTHSVSTLDSWTCLNGFNDSSGYDGGVRDSLFRKFPSLHDREVLEQCSGKYGYCEYSYWFLVKNGDPMLCVDINGRLFRPNGEFYDLKIVYKKERRIWPLIHQTAGDMLP
jgi:hypothetical protein